MDRDAYLEKLKTRLDGWNGELDKLEVQAREVTEDAKTSYQAQIALIRQKRDEVTVKIAELQSSSGEAWEHLKEGMEVAWNSLKDAVAKAESDFKR